MFLKIPYSERELIPIAYTPGRPGGALVPIRNTPITPRQNRQLLFWDKAPLWIPHGEVKLVGDPWNMHMGRGGREAFTDDLGIEWVFEPIAGGSIVHPERPQLLDDVNNWKEKVHIPDPTTWEWEEAVKNTEIDPRFSLQVGFTNGFWFERLISMMGFMPAAMALIDEDQTDAIKEMFQAFTDFGCKVIDLYCEYFPLVDIINFHDDWGSQMAPFFSEDVARELFLPYMKQLCDHIHSLGRIASLHSCGHVDSRIEIFIEAGIDEWQLQTMNDIDWLYDNYGDKMVFNVWPDREDIPQLSEEEQRAEARKFVDRFSKPGKPVIITNYVGARLTDTFKDEVYTYSRKLYASRG